MLSRVLSDTKLPGAIAATIIGNEIRVLECCGIRKVGCDIPITTEDLVHLGSNAKAMTVMAICQLIDRQFTPKISFDSKIVNFFPEQEHNIHAEYKHITLRHLIEHTAGLNANTDWNGISSRLRASSLPDQRYHVISQCMLSAPSESPVGKFHYSNLGYVILGGVIERISGKSWETYMQENVFRPLGITTAGFGVVGVVGSLSQPWGHTADSPHSKGIDAWTAAVKWFKSWRSSSSSNLDGKTAQSDEEMLLKATGAPVQIDNPLVMAPAGCVHCSVPDYCKFLVATKELMRAALTSPNDAHLAPLLGVSAKTYADCLRIPQNSLLSVLHPKPFPAYAGGWVPVSRPWAKGCAFTHSGSNTTWFCSAWVAPRTDKAYVVVFNSGAEESSAAADAVISELIKSSAK